MQSQRSEIRDKIVEKKELTDDTIKQLEAAIAEFQRQFAAGKPATEKKVEREPVAV